MGPILRRPAPVAAGAPPRRHSLREPRVDMLRGFALLCIFVDHMPQDVLNRVTLHNFGFSDAAEAFVLLAGFASMRAYGGAFEREGPAGGLRRVALRCLRLYCYQVALLLVTLVVVWAWTTHYGLDSRHLAPMLNGGLAGLARGLRLTALPAYLDILPLYIVLLGAFPLLWLGMRRAPWLTLAAGAALWQAAGLVPALNLPNWMDGKGWYFNPFAWQFLFLLGMRGAVLLQRCGGRLPRIAWLHWLCIVWLAFAVVQVFPWHDWGLPDLAPLPPLATDKTTLAPVRLLHGLALAYVVLSWDGLGRAVDDLIPRALAMLGRHSLEVFSLATLLALCGRLAFRTYGDGWAMQAAINLPGLLALLALAHVLDGPHPLRGKLATALR